MATRGVTGLVSPLAHRAPGRRWDEAAQRLPEVGPARMAEIGVWDGRMSDHLLRARPRLSVVMVDLWAAGRPGESWYQSGSDMARLTQRHVDDARARAERIAQRYAPRVTVLRMASTVAADRVPDGSLDLVFIDADHSQLAVMADIQAWRPKVAAGGWIGGHDYRAPRFPGVESAVLQEFPRDRVEVGANATWWVRL